MSPELFAIVVLILMFVIASILPINIGVMGFVAAFLVGTLLGDMSANEIFAGFPSNLFILLAGVTFLFAIAQNSGTIDLLMNWCLYLIRDTVALIPWMMFAFTTLLTGVGASSSAGVAIVAPVAMRFSALYGISPLLSPSEQENALRRMPWPVILLVCGMLTYVGVLDKIGGIDYMRDVIAGVGSP